MLLVIALLKTCKLILKPCYVFMQAGNKKRANKTEKGGQSLESKSENILQTSARIMRSSLYGQRIPAQFYNKKQRKGSVQNYKPKPTSHMRIETASSLSCPIEKERITETGG